MPRLASEARLAVAAHSRFYDHSPDVVAVDCETSGVCWYDPPFCSTVAWRSPAGQLFAGFFDLEDEAARMGLADILNTAPALVGHNLKFDLQKLILNGVLERAQLDTKELHDTEAQAHLLNPNARKGLKELAVKKLGYDDTIEVPYKSGPKKGQMRKVVREEHELLGALHAMGLTKEDGYHWLPRSIIYPYAIKDAQFTLRLHEVMFPKLEGRLLELYRSEMELSLVLLDMEAAGYRVDVPYLGRMSEEYGHRIMEHLVSLREMVGEPTFNPGSHQQIKAAFKARGQTLENTDESTLKELADSGDELATQLLDYRGDKKTHSTYLQGLLSEQRDGIFHASFRQHGARTGRMSSGSGG